MVEIFGLRLDLSLQVIYDLLKSGLLHGDSPIELLFCLLQTHSFKYLSGQLSELLLLLGHILFCLRHELTQIGLGVRLVTAALDYVFLGRLELLG